MQTLLVLGGKQVLIAKATDPCVESQKNRAEAKLAMESRLQTRGRQDELS
jgi:hypothetical protein